MRSPRRAAAITLCAASLFTRSTRAQVDLGHKLGGLLGLDAGTAPRPGLFLADLFVYYGAGRVVGPPGGSRDVDLRILANVIGVRGGLEIKPIHGVYSAAISVPLASVHTRSSSPVLSIDKFGLADVFVEPIRLGFRLPHLDLVTAYGFHAPTREFEPGPRGGVSRGQWTHQFAFGAALYNDDSRSLHASALASYELNGDKLGAEITRGDGVNLQGGFGGKVWKLVDVGVVGYGIWQVRDNRGADLPPVLAPLRDRAYGIGGEVGVTIPPIRAQLTLRYAYDVWVRSRPQGQVAAVSLAFKAF